MRSLLPAFALALAAGLASAPLAREAPLPVARYRLSLDTGATGAEARVDVALDVGPLPAGDERLLLRMPEAFAFARLPEPLLLGSVRARTADGAELAVERTGPFDWSVAKGAHERVLLDYAVAMNFRDQPAMKELNDGYECPFAADDHALLVGGALCIEPVADFSPRVRVAAPDGWKAWSPWPRDAAGEFAPADRADLAGGIVALGDFEVSVVAVGGAEVTIAFAPTQRELAPVARPLVESIVAEELATFAVRPFERYMLVFVGSDVRGFGGTVKSGSILMTVSQAFPPATVREHIGHLVAHEFFHTWGMSRYRTPSDLRFVVEGFTDYFAYLTLARLGAISWEAFGAAIGQALAGYQTAAAESGLSLVAAGGPEFFSTRAAYDQVYRGGLALAAILDARLRALLREPGVDLGDFMRAFNNDPRWSPAGTEPGVADFLAAVEAHLDPASRDVCAALLEQAGQADLAGALAAAGVDVRAAAAPLALEANLDGTRIVDIDPASAAFAVGLRPGDRLLSVNGTAVAAPADVHRAFPTCPDGRLRVQFLRGERELAIDEPAPARQHYTVDPAVFRGD